MITALIAEVIELVGNVIAIFGEAPLVFFVYLALVGAAVGIVRRLIPTRR